MVEMVEIVEMEGGGGDGTDVGQSIQGEVAKLISAPHYSDITNTHYPLHHNPLLPITVTVTQY